MLVCLATFAAACQDTPSAPAEPSFSQPPPQPQPQTQPNKPDAATATIHSMSSLTTNDTDRTDRQTPAASLQPRHTSTTPATKPQPTLLPDEPPPQGASREFSTDFSRHTVPYNEILSGGVPKDGIPTIDDPTFVSIAEADTWLKLVEPVIVVEVNDDARAYPIQILIWHEIVNDEVGGLPLSVTFCPLCNTAIVFERTVNDMVLDFGTSGRLRYSNLIMYDRQTETWWQQANGEAIAGEFAGHTLEFYPAQMIAWADFKDAHPDGTVLSRETGYNRAYGSNPYVGYDDVATPPFLYDGPPTPGTLLPVERILAVEYGNETVAYPFGVLKYLRVLNDTVDTLPVVVLWSAGTSSALDAVVIAEGRDVGAANAYERTVDDQTLTFVAEGDTLFRDEQTNSIWNARGEAISGDLAGTTLRPIVAVNHFWFSWAAFKPETRVYEP